MEPNLKLTFAAALPTTGVVLVPVVRPATGTAIMPALVAEALGARAAEAAATATALDFSGKPGETAVLPLLGNGGTQVVILLGLGEATKLTADDAVGLGGRVVAALRGRFEQAHVFLSHLSIAGIDGANLASAAALGARLRAYSFDNYRVKSRNKDDKQLEALTFVVADAAAVSTLARDAVAEGVRLARDLVTEPPNVLHPESFAERCRDLEAVGVKVTILDEPAMRALGMGSLLGVGQGSVRGSRLVAMEWRGGNASDRPLALCGKGVTFDTGGISLKPGPGMEEMKFDMGGAAAVCGAMLTLARRKARANVVGLVGLVENMPDGNAQRPADVVTSMSGQTIEILNTDAEGRLVLADVLTYAQRTYQPHTIIDLATLTGAIIISLAHEYGGLFANDDALAARLLAAGERTGERLWRMPVGKAHDEMLKSDIADMKNIGPREGGSSSAAAFIARFVDDGVLWAHLDIAGMAWSKKDQDHCPKGATGYGVRLLDEYVRTVMEG